MTPEPRYTRMLPRVLLHPIGQVVLGAVFVVGTLGAEATGYRSLGAAFGAMALWAGVFGWGIFRDWGNVWTVWAAREQRRVDQAPPLAKRAVSFLRRDGEVTRITQGLLGLHVAGIFGVLAILALLRLFG